MGFSCSVGRPLGRHVALKDNLHHLIISDAAKRRSGIQGKGLRSLDSRLRGNDDGGLEKLSAWNLTMRIEKPTKGDWTLPSTAVDCGESEKVSERSKIASSFRAAGRDAYRDVGGRATQEAKAEERREPAGWRPGRSSPSWRRGICASMHGRANGFAYFSRKKSKSGARRCAHLNNNIA